jgi:MSHA biogenesis protein MshJ
VRLPPAIERHAARFDRLSVRERVMVAAATTVALVMGWTVVVFDPAAARERALDAEAAGLQESIAAMSASAEAAGTPLRLALEQEKQLTEQLASVNAQLASQSAGLIPPERMVEVIHDVLSRQRDLTLISLHNKPVTSLTPASTDASAAARDPGGPYVHPVELVIEGSYLDVLAYLRALEQLEWRFYWKVLELETTRYPINRVRIELSTLSMEKDWLGV